MSPVGLVIGPPLVHGIIAHDWSRLYDVREIVETLADPRLAVAFLVLAATGTAAAYRFGVRPRTRRDRLLVALTIAFLLWMLPLMAWLRSR
jgi:hypothetical protein